MKKTLIATLVSLFAVVGAHAAATDGAVTTSTDPAKAAAVERHAQELRAQESKPPAKPVVHVQKKAVKPVAHVQKKAAKHHKRHVAHKSAAKK